MRRHWSQTQLSVVSLLRDRERRKVSSCRRSSLSLCSCNCRDESETHTAAQRGKKHCCSHPETVLVLLYKHNITSNVRKETQWTRIHSFKDSFRNSESFTEEHEYLILHSGQARLEVFRNEVSMKMFHMLWNEDLIMIICQSQNKTKQQMNISSKSKLTLETKQPDTVMRLFNIWLHTQYLNDVNIE